MEAPENKRQNNEENLTSSEIPLIDSSSEEGVNKKDSASVDEIPVLSGSLEQEKLGVDTTPQEESIDIDAILKQASEETPSKQEIVLESPPSEVAPVDSDDITALLSSIEKEKGELPPTGSKEELDIDAVLKQAESEASLDLPKTEPPLGEGILVEKPINSTEVHSEKSSSESLPESPSEVAVEKESIPAAVVPKKLFSTENPLKEFDISTDPHVIELRARMKEKVQEILKTFINFKTFSISFIVQMPQVILRRRKVKQGLRVFSEWIENERALIQATEDLVKKERLEKASIIFDQEMLILRKKGVLWIRQGWRKSFLILIWIVSLIMGLAFGLPSVARIYFPKALHKPVVTEIVLNENISTEEIKKDVGPTSYLLLSCEQSQMGKLGKIRVYDREGKEVAIFPANVNKMKKKVLTEVPAGELGVIIETGEYPIVGKLEIFPSQRRFIDLSKWTDIGARALVRIQSTPEGIPIVCNGGVIGKGFASVYFIAGIHKIWAALPNFPAQEQHLMVVDDRELDLVVTVNMGRFVFQCSDQIKKMHPQLKIYVNGSLILNWESYPLLFGYYTIKITDAGKTVMQQEINLAAADEVVFRVQRLEEGVLSGALVSKRNLLKSN